MPNKKNADSLEHLRSKSTRLSANLINLLMMLKGLPTGYNSDLQEDKIMLFNSIDTLFKMLPVLVGVIKTLTVNNKNIEKRIDPLSLATEVADYLTKKDIPFRQAHHITGEIVKYCLDNNKKLNQLTLDEFKKYSGYFDSDIFQWLDFNAAIERRNVYGGTAQNRILEQLVLANQKLNDLKKWLNIKPGGILQKIEEAYMLESIG